MKKILFLIALLPMMATAGTNYINVPFGGFAPIQQFFDTNRFVLSAWWTPGSPWLTNPWVYGSPPQTNLTLWPSNSGPPGLFTSNYVENVMPWQGWQAVDTNFYVMDDRISFLETNAVSSNSFAFNTKITNNSGHTASYLFMFSTSTGGTQPVDLRVLVDNANSGTWNYVLPYGMSAAVTGTFTNIMVIPDVNTNAVLMPSNYNASATVTAIGVVRIAK